MDTQCDSNLLRIPGEISLCGQILWLWKTLIEQKKIIVFDYK